MESPASSRCRPRRHAPTASGASEESGGHAGEPGGAARERASSFLEPEGCGPHASASLGAECRREVLQGSVHPRQGGADGPLEAPQPRERRGREPGAKRGAGTGSGGAPATSSALTAPSSRAIAACRATSGAVDGWLGGRALRNTTSTAPEQSRSQVRTRGDTGSPLIAAWAAQQAGAAGTEL